MACFHPCLQERLHHLPRHSGPSLLTHQLTTPPQPSLWEQLSCWPFRLQSSPAGPPIPYLWSTTSSWEVNQITSGKVFQWLRVLGSSSSPCTWPKALPSHLFGTTTSLRLSSLCDLPLQFSLLQHSCLALSSFSQEASRLPRVPLSHHPREALPLLPAALDPPLSYSRCLPHQTTGSLITKAAGVPGPHRNPEDLYN